MAIAFMFSGQGAQAPGMMSDLYDQYQSVRDVFSCASNAIGKDIAKLTFEGTEEELSQTCNTQPCVLAADLAASAVLSHYGIRPDYVAGFSLGEYAALVASSVIVMDDAFDIVSTRAQAMQDAVPPGEGAMAAMIGAEADEIEAICQAVCDGYVAPANYNSPEQTVIAGDVRGVDGAISIAAERGIKSIRLQVSVPSHCDLMKPAQPALESALSRKCFSKPKIPIFMNVTAEALRDGDQAKKLLEQQLINPVRWHQTLENLRIAGVDTFIECGPGKTLWGLARKTIKGARILRVGDAKSLAKTLESQDIVA